MAELSARIRLVEGSTSIASARTHSVVVDRPLDKGGSDLGFLGGELLLVAEGGCFMSNFAAAANARGIAVRRVEATVRGIQADAPSRFSEVIVEVAIDADAPDDDIDKLLTIAERACIVSNTLRGGTTLTIRRADPVNE